MSYSVRLFAQHTTGRKSWRVCSNWGDVQYDPEDFVSKEEMQDGSRVPKETLGEK